MSIHRIGREKVHHGQDCLQLMLTAYTTEADVKKRGPPEGSPRNVLITGIYLRIIRFVVVTVPSGWRVTTMLIPLIGSVRRMPSME